MVRMWDGHTLIVNVDAKLKGKVKSGDVVLVDYYPSDKFKNPIPKILLTKVLKGKKAKKVVDEYRNYKSRMKKVRGGPADQGHGRYIG
jgi:hypothetical protein